MLKSETLNVGKKICPRPKIQYTAPHEEERQTRERESYKERERQKDNERGSRSSFFFCALSNSFFLSFIRVFQEREKNTFGGC
jgi:hypothetical protein